MSCAPWPHVKVVSPVIWQISTGGGLEVIDGIDIASFEALGGPFQYVEGGPFRGPDDVLVDDYIARQRHVKVGDTMEILNHNFRISGVVENGRAARKFVSHGHAAGFNGSERQGLRLLCEAGQSRECRGRGARSETPARYGEIRRAVDRRISQHDDPSNLPGFRPFIGVVIGVSLVIGFLVIFQSMYTPSWSAPARSAS